MLTPLRNTWEKYHKPGAVYLGLVHRLDRPVGGVMVFARTSKAASRLSAQVREGLLEKAYRAVVCDVRPMAGSRTILSGTRVPIQPARSARHAWRSQRIPRVPRLKSVAA